MINTIVAYDDEDMDLGDYCIASHADFVSFIGTSGQVINNSVRGLDCTEVYINKTIAALNGGRFIFVGVCHGDEESLVANEIFVSSNNSNNFSNSFFYSCACLAGDKLGNILIKSGCLAFIGYYGEVFIIENYHDVFYTCQNYAIKSFLSNDETVIESYEKMRNYYTSEIDRLLTGGMDDTIAASSLIGNRDCLISLGNLQLTRIDFR